MSDADKECWYTLNAEWHPSRNTRLGSVHLRYSTKSGAMCNPSGTALNDDAMSEACATGSGYSLCKRCLKAAGIKPDGRLPQRETKA